MRVSAVGWGQHPSSPTINMSDQSNFRSRRRSKLIGFIVAEASAITLLLLAGTLVLSSRPVDSAFVAAMNVVLIAAAAAVAAIPIFFFALPAVLPRDPR